MGCGVSKLNKDEMGPTYLYYNPLHRRIDDLNPWRTKADRAASAADPSTTKQLLEDDSVSTSLAGDGCNEHGRKCVSASFIPADKANGVSPNMYECIVKLPPTPQQMMKPDQGWSHGSGGKIIVEAADNKNGRSGGDGGGKEEAVMTKGSDQEKKAMASSEDKSGKPNSTNDEKEKVAEEQDEIDKLELSDREDSILYPGSPSFREYCFSSNNTSAGAGSNKHIDVPDDLISDDDHRESDDVDLRFSSVAVESQKEDNNIPPSVDSVKKPDEPARTQSGKKSRRPRGKRFRMGLPRTGSGGVRNLWSASSCSPHRTAEKPS